jgi:hypothetical protein
MDIIEVVAQVRALLQQQGRLSYRIVQRQFAVDDAALEDVKFELINTQEVAADRDGKILVWTGRPSEQPVRGTERTKAEVPPPVVRCRPRPSDGN